MEKACEFCTVLRPVVYCKADAAHLCLPCDGRVHSANALSGRHVRTLLCVLCQHRAAYYRCVDHRMFICRVCERTLHGFSTQHQTQVLNAYAGCPSPKDFTVLWNFDPSILDECVTEDPHASSASCCSLDGNSAKSEFDRQTCLQFDGLPSASGANVNAPAIRSSVDSKVGSSSQQTRVRTNGQHLQVDSIILQQILHLKRIQLNEQNNDASLMGGKEQANFYSSRYDFSMKPVGDIDQFSQLFIDKGDSCPPFSLLQNISSTPAVDVSPHGDPFWLDKIPADSSQLWSQNMQDLGFCEEFDSFDDVDIPDVDPTFHNFEELFGGDQNPTRELLDEKDVAYSSMENSISLDKSDNGIAEAFEGASAASSIKISLSEADINRGMNDSNGVHGLPENADLPLPRRSSYSSMTYSLSRLSTPSNDADSCFETGVSSIISRRGPSDNLPFTGAAQCTSKQSTVTRYSEKNVLMLEKQKPNRYLLQKASARLKKRVKGQTTKAHGYESDGLNTTQSY